MRILDGRSKTKSAHMWHIIFWIIYILFTVSIYSIREADILMHLTYEVTTLPVKISFVYTTLYGILPIVTSQKKYTRAALSYVTLLILSVFLLQLCVSFFFYPIYFNEHARLSIFENLAKLVSPTLDLLIVSFIAISIQLLRERESAERLRVESQLNALKSQLHPHFLFNSLNGIYSLTLKHSPLASGYILKLSSILRYILYEGNMKSVELSKEIDCVKNYVEMEKMRYGSKLLFNFRITGNPESKFIAPLILIPFIENSFKHGVAPSMEPSEINAVMEISESHLRMKLSNKIITSVNPDEKRAGLGLDNIRQRLKYLYQDNYSLTIKKDNFFNVDLIVPISRSDKNYPSEGENVSVG